MASKLSIRRVHIPNRCVWCESIQDVNWYCNDCQEVLCDRCFEAHPCARKEQNNIVVSIKEATRHGGVVLLELCATHPGNSCDLFCTECYVTMCSKCLTQKHKQHIYKYFEEEIDSQTQNLHDQLSNLNSCLDVHFSTLTKRNADSKIFKESADVIRQTVQTQRLKLKAEIDSIADSVLVKLSTLVEDEEKSHDQDCQYHETTIKDIKQLIGEAEQKKENVSISSLFELTGRLRTTIPLYAVSTKSVLHSPPYFMPGNLNTDQLKSMIGSIPFGKLKNEDDRYVKKEVDSKQNSQISTFQVPQQKTIASICPIDNIHAWMSVYDSTQLIKVHKEGKVTESVKLQFYPWCLTLINTEELLITSGISLIHKLSKDRRVMRFTDISPLKARGISISDSDEVFVTTHTATIQVLNMSGERIRQISCGGDGLSIVCLTTGNIAVTTGFNTVNCKEMIVINKTNQIIHKWSRELDNGQKLKKTMQYDIARDRYDRVFVPDCFTNQIYVLSGNERKAKCLLNKKHGVNCPTAVCVDSCGHVWIGSQNGTVHVIKL